MSFNLQLLLVVVLTAGVVLAWLRSRGDRATTARGRLRQVAWLLALAGLTLSVIAALAPLDGRAGIRRGMLVLALVVAAVVAVWPSLARRVGPVAFIAAGLFCLALARDYVIASTAGVLATPASAAPGPKGGSAGFSPSGTLLVEGGGAEQYLLLAQAYLFLVLGGWLAWRSLCPVPARGRFVLGRAVELAPRAQLRALLLLPVLIMAAELVPPDQWSAAGASLFAVLALGSGLAILRRWPGAAARLAVAGLFVLGLVGLVLATKYQYGQAPNEYGLVILADRHSPGLVVAEAIALFAIGAWLMPQTFPAAGRLLGLAPDAELTRQVRRLAESRAVVVDTAASDLRRLERDLHDGAQARLVALGMSLRAAERLIPLNPDAAVALVAEARATSARALTELRELVRGVHPPVLADRGLTDAVRALALDCPLAVETRIELPGRPPAPVETACYFAVAELLTNAAKHSGAHEARIDVSYADRRLRVEVTDFGLGGADPAAGSGLAGVEKRLAAFDGIMAISSPPGGPTIAVLEVPCALSSAKTSSY